MNRLILFLILIASAFVAKASLVYDNSGNPPYEWSNEAAWGGTLPTLADDAIVRTDFSPESPLTIASADLASAKSLTLGDTGTTYAGNVIRLNVFGSLGIGDGTSVWGSGSVTNLILIGTGGALSAAGRVNVGNAQGAFVSITNNGSMTFGGPLYFGYANGSEAILENFGSLKIGSEFYIGRSTSSKKLTKASVRIRPDSTFDLPTGAAINLGYGGVGSSGELVLESSWPIPTNAVVKCGAYAGDEGSFVVGGNAVVTPLKSWKLCLGNETGSSGELKVRDHAYLLCNGNPYAITAATAEDSIAKMSIEGSAFVESRSYPIGLGTGKNSKFKLEMSGCSAFTNAASVEVASGAGSCASIRLLDRSSAAAGGWNFGSGGATVDVEVAEGAVLSDSDVSQFMSSPLSKGVMNVVLRGGALEIKTRKSVQSTISSPYSFYLGTNGANAVVRGWGAIRGITVPTTNARLGSAMRGRIVADGFGTPRDLDTTQMDIRVDGDSVNGDDWGWYAESGGRLFLSHTETLLSSSEMTIGDDPNLSVPRLVNALHVSLQGKAGTSDNYVFASLYASDRPEVPIGLPSGKDDEVLAVWNVGYVYAPNGRFSPADPSAKRNFTSATVTARHATKFASKRRGTYRIDAYRYDGSAWQKLSSAEFDANNPYVTFSDLSQIDTLYNIGWLAVVAHYNRPGICLIVR